MYEQGVVDMFWQTASSGTAGDRVSRPAMVPRQPLAVRLDAMLQHGRLDGVERCRSGCRLG